MYIVSNFIEKLRNLQTLILTLYTTVGVQSYNPETIVTYLRLVPESIKVKLIYTYREKKKIKKRIVLKDISRERLYASLMKM